MTATAPRRDNPTASYTCANWQRMLNGAPRQLTTEATLFTDSWVTGQVDDLGPYSFINTIAHASGMREKILRPAIVMRVQHHHSGEDIRPPLPMENDFEHYHGGDYLDEMAALASLFLGARLKAGGENRQFEGEGDLYGRPMQTSGKPDPQLSLDGRHQIPRLALPVNLNSGLKPLGKFPACTIAQTNALIKAARQYQQAVWIADADPSLAWLMLVSAIETAALEWSSDAAPVEQLDLAFPELVKLIQESGSPDLLLPVAEILKQLTRSTKRFVDFGLAFAPAPPSVRPEGWMQFSYTPDSLKEAFKLIYDHRSRALHGGVAFPMPMCEAPQFTRQGDALAVQEKPHGLAMSSRNATWKIEKTPMLLNTFEHVVRGALLNWWKSLGEKRTS